MPYTLTMEKPNTFERDFVAHITAMVEGRDIKHTDFGKYVFGELSGVRIWRYVRDEKRQRFITLSEAERMAEYFREDLSSLIKKVEQKAKQG